MALKARECASRGKIKLELLNTQDVGSNKISVAILANAKF